MAAGISETTLRWHADLAFQVEQDGHAFMIDTLHEDGSAGAGPRPKALVLTALAGCAGIDVVSILGKMRVTYEGLEIRVKAQAREEHPRIFTGIHMTFVFRGKGLPMEKLERAVKLSEEVYCGVSAMLRPTVPITTEIQVLD